MPTVTLAVAAGGAIGATLRRAIVRWSELALARGVWRP